MPRVSPAPPPRRPPGPPPRRPAAPPTLGEPRDMKDRPRGWKLALRRQRRRLRPTLYGIGALTVLTTTGYMLYATSHAESLTSLRQRFGGLGAAFGLRVENIVVQGRTATPEPLLDAAIGVEKGDPLLGFSVDAARARIVTLASVQDVTVERRWPSTLLVSLTERHPFAVWQNQGKFVLIDRDGSLLADQDVRLAGDLPLVVGIGAPASAAPLLDLIDQHPVIKAHLVAAVRVGDRRWNLRLTSGADVLLPEDGQDQALGRLDALQADHQIMDRKLQVVDLRLADRTTLRPDSSWQPAPAAPDAKAPDAPAPAAAPAAAPPPAPEAPLTPADPTRRPT